jgi:hypothetical protein
MKRRHISAIGSQAIFLALMCWLGASVLTSQAAWYNGDWKYRQQITITNGLAASTLTNFPVLIQITNVNHTVFASAQADGRDIYFADAGGIIRYAHEMEKFTNGATKEMDAWVKIPALPATGTNLYMYYGNTNVGDQQNVAAVWDPTFKSVWHLSEAVTNNQTQRDSTTNANLVYWTDPFAAGGPGVAGQIDGSDHFNGSNQYAGVNNSSSLNIYGAAMPMTLSAWVKFGIPAQDSVIIGKGVYPTYEYKFGCGSSPSSFHFHVNSNGQYCAVTATNGGFTGWHQWAGVYDGASLKLYLDGSLVATTNHSGVVNQDANIIRFGNYVGGGFFFNGWLDEVRIANVARPPDWLSAEYRTSASPSAYLAFGAVENRPRPEWYNLAWKYRQWITLAPGLADSTLAGFPALIQITNQNNAVFGRAQADGRDIFFTDSTGTNKFSHQIEKYTNGVSKELEAWVQIPSLPTDGLGLYMYYGNAAAADQQNAGAVWAPSCRGVWHLGEAGTNGVVQRDSTTNANHGGWYDANGLGAAGAPGQIDGADRFDGAEDYVFVGSPSSLNIYGTSNPVTLTAWVKYATPGQESILIKLGTYPYYEYGFAFGSSPFSVTFMVGENGSVVDPKYIRAPILDTNWHYFAGVYDGAGLKLYRDGNLITTTNHNGVVPQNTGAMYIGTFYGGNYEFNGWLDEVRVANTARSADWIMTEYRNAALFNTYVYVGAQEVPPAGSVVLIR